MGNEVLNLIFEQITFSTVPKPAFLFQDYILQAFSFVGQLFKTCQAVVFHCFPLFCLFPNWRQPLVIIARLCAIDYKRMSQHQTGAKYPLIKLLFKDHFFSLLWSVSVDPIVVYREHFSVTQSESCAVCAVCAMGSSTASKSFWGHLDPTSWPGQGSIIAAKTTKTDQ